MTPIRRVTAALFIYTFFYAAACLAGDEYQPAMPPPSAQETVQPAATPPPSAQETAQPTAVTAAPRTGPGGIPAAVQPPENPAARAEGVKVYLSWDDVKAGGVTYNIYRSVTPAANFMKINKEPVEINVYLDDRDTS